MESLQENKWYENITLKEAKTFIQSNIQNVDRSMKTIGRSVIAIGYYLKNVRDRSLYLEDGYNSIWDFAAGEYEISKSAASRYMTMNDRYSVDGNSPVVAEQYREFGKSQLQEMLYLTDEQLDEVTPDSTVAQIRKLRQPEEPPTEEEEQIPGQQDIETDYPEWCPGYQAGSTTVSAAEAFGMDLTLPEEEQKKGPCTVSLEDLTEPVATSQQKRPCIHRPEFDCHLTAEQMETPGDGKDCEGKCCWDCTARGECTIECYSSAGRPVMEVQQEKKNAAEVKLSAYGTPKTVYAEGSLLKEDGCEGGHSCFCCAMECEIRGKERYCREAPLGNPFPCEIVKYGFEGLPESCQFVNHDLAYHMQGSGGASPCCKNCQAPCEYICGRAMKKLDQGQSSIVDAEFREIPQRDPKEPLLQEELSDLDLLRNMLEKENKQLAEIINVNRVEPDPSLDMMIRKRKLLVGALAGMLCDLENVVEPLKAEQPDLPNLKNNDQRKEWLNTFHEWPVWFEVPEAAEVYYRYDLPDGSSLVICEYHYWASWKVEFDYCKGDPECTGTREYLLVPGYHYLDDCKSNRTAMVEKLKEVQK